MMKTKTILSAMTLALLMATISSLALANANPSLSLKGPQWKIYNFPITQPPFKYTDVGHATTIPTGGVSFDFPDANAGEYAAILLTTYNVPLTGQMSAKINVVASSATFAFNPNGGPTPSNVRLFFQTTNNAGADPGPFATSEGKGSWTYTDFWWSNPTSYNLANGGTTLTVAFNPALWSDWNGQKGNVDAQTTAAFYAALQNVKYVGLSFGGGDFFENGVGVSSGSATFQLTDFTIS
jgi:hypothetical protein